MKNELKFTLILALFILAILIFFDFKSSLSAETNELVSIRFINSLLFGGVVVLTYHTAILLTKNYTVAFFGASSTIFTFLLVNSFIGWTHTLTVFLILLGFYSFLKFEQNKRMKFLILLSFSIGFVFVVRYLDIIFFIPISIYLIFHLLKDHKIKFLLVFIVLSAIFSLPAFVFNYLAFGDPLLSPYHMRPFSLPPHPKVNIVEFQFERLPINIYNIFINFDPNNVLPYTEDTDYKFRSFKSSIFQSSPFLVFSIFGFLTLRKILSKKVFWILLSSLSLIAIFYGSLKFYGGGWTTNMRYFSPIIPFLSIFSSSFIFHHVKFYKIDKVFLFTLFFVFLLLSKIFFVTLQEQSVLSSYHPKQFMNMFNLGAYLISAAMVVTCVQLNLRKVFSKYFIPAVYFFLLYLGFLMNFFVDGYFSFHGSKSDLFISNIMSGNLILTFIFIFSVIFILLKINSYFRFFKA